MDKHTHHTRRNESDFNQICVENGYSTLQCLYFWIKYGIYYPLKTYKLYQMTSGFILKKRRKNTRGRFQYIISKQNIKLIIATLLSRVGGQYGYQKKRNSSRKSIFLVWCAVFQPKLNKLQKTAEKWLF